VAVVAGHLWCGVVSDGWVDGRPVEVQTTEIDENVVDVTIVQKNIFTFFLFFKTQSTQLLYKMNFEVETNFTYYTLAAQDTTVVVHFHAPPANAERVPVDIVLVSDVSGSMFGPKMDLLKQASRILVRETTANDRVGLVEFSTEARTSSGLKKMDDAGKRDVSACIERMISGGGTNLSAGLFMGIQQLVDAPSQRVRSVFLMTDGRANEGLIYLKEILHVLNGLLANTGITIHAFGYGADHDSTLLRGVMNGSFYFVEGVDDLRGSFGDCLGGLLSVVAQNILVTLEGVNGATIKKVHHKNAEMLEDGRVRVPFSDVYGDEHRDLVIDVTLPEGSETVVKATLSYVDAVNARSSTVSTDVAVKRLEKVDNLVPNPKVELQVARLRVSRSLDAARQAAEKSDMTKARGLLLKEKEELGMLRKRTGSVAMLDDFDEDVERGLRGLQNEASFKTARHEMASASEAHEQQRAMSCGSQELVRQTSYQTKSKESMKAKFSEPTTFKP
jgi:secreted protein with Ig-like and vWFA domain